jgi:hypothetical protein
MKRKFISLKKTLFLSLSRLHNSINMTSGGCDGAGSGKALVKVQLFCDRCIKNVNGAKSFSFYSIHFLCFTMQGTFFSRI